MSLKNLLPDCRGNRFLLLLYVSKKFIIMSKIDLTPIKRKLESMRCQKCGESPEVILTGDNIRLKFCCEDFRSQVENSAQQIVTEYFSI